MFIFQECAALAKAGADVTLLCGKGSLDDRLLFRHYMQPYNAFSIQRMPIVRKNNLLNLSWNYPFFHFTQRYIEREKPDFVLLSVLKQAAFHLKRKVDNVRYLYEVHELAAYPHQNFELKKLEMEKQFLMQADIITVTTQALKEILQNPPYSLLNHIEVVPLAVHARPLPLPNYHKPLTLFYVGQLYSGQGVDLAIKAIAKTQGIHLKIVGGTNAEIYTLKTLAAKLNALDKITFLGFKEPHELPFIVQEGHAFIAPFTATSRMPYVAHTKLCEYTAWGRPIIAPDLSVVHEHFGSNKGALLFEPNNAQALKGAMEALKEQSLLTEMQHEITHLSPHYSWQTRAEGYLKLLQ